MLENRKDGIGSILEGLIESRVLEGEKRGVGNILTLENSKEIEMKYDTKKQRIEGKDKMYSYFFTVSGSKSALDDLWDDIKAFFKEETTFPDVSSYIRKEQKKRNIDLSEWNYYFDSAPEGSLDEAKLPTWAVTGQNPDDMRPKTVIVKAKDKETAIANGLEKIGTKVFIDCKLRST